MGETEEDKDVPLLPDDSTVQDTSGIQENVHKDESTDGATELQTCANIFNTVSGFAPTRATIYQ